LMFQESVRFSPAPGLQQAEALAPLRVGLIGLGTVGAGTYRVLTRNQHLIAGRCGRGIEVTKVAVRNTARAQALVDSSVAVLADPFAVVNHPDIDVVVETMGGTTLAKELVLQAIANGKHVVTANKALLAEHGTEIFEAAQARGVIVAYEGAVAVAIPIIKALREGLAVNQVEWIAGIVNGTTNFILSEMGEKGLDFASALREAQARGFAEADPKLDVQGVDAAHKLSLLAANAFGTPVMFDQVQTEGIADVQPQDLAFAQQLGYRIKLLALARCDEQGLHLSVRPTLVAATHWLASVSGSMNGIMVRSDAAGDTFYYGAGAGSEQTGSAVVADLMDVARALHCPAQYRVPYLGTLPQAQRSLAVVPPLQQHGVFYVRCDANVLQAPQLLQHLSQHGVPVHTHAVRPTQPAHPATATLLLTGAVREDVLRLALDAISTHTRNAVTTRNLPIADFG
jgi:homoserine dehydrogenase